MVDMTTGNYINVFNDDLDVFVILNEANDMPTTEEVDLIASTVKELLDKNEDDMEVYYKEINKLGLNCTSFGIQVIVVMNYYDDGTFEERMEEWLKKR